jgi:hypothetical protein
VQQKIIVNSQLSHIYEEWGVTVALGKSLHTPKQVKQHIFEICIICMRIVDAWILDNWEFR